MDDSVAGARRSSDGGGDRRKGNNLSYDLCCCLMSSKNESEDSISILFIAAQLADFIQQQRAPRWRLALYF